MIAEQPTNPSRDPECIHCRFYSPIFEDDNITINGFCRFHAPLISDDSMIIWPEVSSNDWCGQWREHFNSWWL